MLATCWSVYNIAQRQTTSRSMLGLSDLSSSGSDKFPECQERFIERAREREGGGGLGKEGLQVKTKKPLCADCEWIRI